MFYLQMVNIVIIGSGSIAFSRHIPSLKASKSGNLYGFYNRTFQRTLSVTEKLGGKAFRTLEEIWEDDLVDAVIISTPAPSHFQLTMSALAAGKHVLCEKPLSVNAIEAKLMTEAAIKSGKKLMIAHAQRLYRPHIKAKELLDRNEIGKLLTFRTFLGVGDKEESVSEDWKSSIAEVGSHRIDLMHYLIGSDVKRVFAYLTKLNPNLKATGDDNAMTILEYQNGVRGVLISSRTSYNGNDRMTQLFGTEGAITLYGEKHSVIVEKENGEKNVYTFANELPQSVMEPTTIVGEFLDAIENDTEPIITGKDGLAVMKTLDAIYLSNSEERWVDLDEVEIETNLTSRERK